MISIIGEVKHTKGQYVYKCSACGRLDGNIGMFKHLQDKHKKNDCEAAMILMDTVFKHLEGKTK